MKKIIGILVMACITMTVFAQSYTVALKDIPSAKHYKALLIAIGKVTDTTFIIKKYPQARAAYMLEENQVDIEGPEIAPENTNSSNNFIYSTSIVGSVAFVLYTKNDIDLNGSNKIGIDQSNKSMIALPTIIAANGIGAMKSVNSGSLDAYIAAQTVGDPILNKLPDITLTKQLYKVFPITFGISKGLNQIKIDKVLTKGIEILKKNGKYNEIMGPFLKSTAFTKELLK